MLNLKIKKVAREAVQQAGEMAAREFARFDRANITLKSHHEILTKVDLASEKIIITAIKKNFPEHQILSEESGRNRKVSDYFWIIDPIDGTTNFSMHNPLWSISLAIAFKGKLILGLIYAPILGEFYEAEKGKGSYLFVGQKKKRLHVSHIKKGKVLNTFCHGRDEKHVRRAIKYYAYQKLHALDCRQLGSAALELAFVAAGRIESIIIPGANAWDVAAGVLLVREAGGRVTDFAGRPWNLTSPDMLASNGRVHADILKIIKTQKI